MVARSAPCPYVPETLARLAVAADGTRAAIIESTRVVVVDLPEGRMQTEIGLDATAEAIDVAWIPAPPRLLVLARHETYCTAHLVDPDGPRTVAEIRLEAPMRLVAAVGSHALVVGPLGAALLAASEALLVPYQFNSRATPALAGIAGTQFVVALAGVIEEWDPISRMPKRRLRLARSVPITALGGSERLVWMTTAHEPARIDVIPLVNRGQPRFHDLPEEIAQVAGHPRGDVVACIAGGRLYAVDLDGRTRLRTLAPEGLDRVDAAALTGAGILAAQAGRPLAFVPLDTRESEPPPSPRPRPPAPEEPPKRSSLVDESEPASSILRARMRDADPVPSAPAPPPEPSVRPEVSEPTMAPLEPVAVLDDSADLSDAPPLEEAAPRPRGGWGTSLSDRLAALRHKDRSAEVVRSNWRDDVVQWARAQVAGAPDRAPAPAPPIETIANAFDVPHLVPAFMLLYGAHLAGHEGVAPADLSRVLGRTWDEALGRGRLAELGLARFERSRVVLADPIRRALDELPPLTGTLAGEGTDRVFVAHDGANPADAQLEARAYGAKLS